MTTWIWWFLNNLAIDAPMIMRLFSIESTILIILIRVTEGII